VNMSTAIQVALTASVESEAIGPQLVAYIDYRFWRVRNPPMVQVMRSMTKNIPLTFPRVYNRPEGGQLDRLVCLSLSNRTTWMAVVPSLHVGVPELDGARAFNFTPRRAYCNDP
jgi:hypothetical protein